METKENVKYVVITTDEFEGECNPTSEQEDFDNLEDADAYYAEQVSKENELYGGFVRVELFKITIDEDGDEDIETINSGSQDSMIIPEGSIIVFFRHLTYMNYCYEVIGLEEVIGEKYYSELPSNPDNTFREWAMVEPNLDTLIDDYENGRGCPFDKLNKGRKVIEQFLKEQGASNYQDAEEEEIEEED